MVVIILVNFNGSDDTIDCIISLNGLTYKNYEIVVVDNCSSDDSIEDLERAKAIYHFTLLKSNENKGFSTGNNIGIRYALEHNADYIWILNNDTLVEPGALEKLLTGFTYDKKCGITIGKIFFEQNRNIVWYAGGAFDPWTARTEHWNYGRIETSKQSICNVTFATGCCMLVSRQAIEKVGLFDEDYFLYEEDVDYSYRMTTQGYKMVYVPEAVIFHKVSASTGQASSVSQYYSIRNKYLLIRKYFRGIRKLTAYSYLSLQLIYRCLKGELKYTYYRKAFKAFLAKEVGKRERNI